MGSKAIFLDRDGVINADTHYPYLSGQIEFIPGIFDFCRKARAQGYLLIVITNQSGIGRGLFSEEQFHALMKWMMARFEKENCPLDAYYFCPHVDADKCNCRKPKPGMIIQAAKEWDVDVAQSVLIGDKERDVEAGRAAGLGKVVLFEGVFPSLRGA